MVKKIDGMNILGRLRLLRRRVEEIDGETYVVVTMAHDMYSVVEKLLLVDKSGKFVLDRDRQCVGFMRGTNTRGEITILGQD